RECHLREITVDELACGGSWRAPSILLTNLHTRFDQGQLSVRANLNTASRSLEASVTSDVDPHKLAPFLPESAQRSLAQFVWDQPPVLSVQAALVLPAWTNQEPNW